jgi:molybdenum cofactor cytidylyltransferase
MGICGVILAAGDSVRMGRDKALLPCPPVRAEESPTQLSNSSVIRPPTFANTLLSAAVEALSRFCDFVLVVVGKNEPQLHPLIDACGGFLVLNAHPERGQFSSLQVGLREVLNRGRDAAMITLVDRPPPRPQTLDKLMSAFEARDRNIWAIIPDFQGKHGHPILIGREMIEAFLQAAAISNARDIEHDYESRIAYVSVDDMRVTINLNTPEDYASISQYESA